MERKFDHPNPIICAGINMINSGYPGSGSNYSSSQGNLFLTNERLIYLASQSITHASPFQSLVLSFGDIAFTSKSGSGWIGQALALLRLKSSEHATVRICFVRG